MKIVSVQAIPMSDPVPRERQHRTDLGTKVKSDATLIVVETDSGLKGIGAALGAPPVVAAIVEHELAPECVGEDPLYSARIYEKMYNGSRAQPALERGVPQPEVNRRSGVVMEAIAGVDIAIWDVKAQALGIPAFQPLGPGQRSRSRARRLRRERLLRGQDARGRARRLLHREMREARGGRAPRHRRRRRVDGRRARLARS